MDADERKAHREIDKDLFTDPEKKRIAARNKAYYEANREEIAARNKAYREANREECSQFGQALRRARKAHGYTQSDLSRFLHISRSLVGHYETGVLSVPADKLQILVGLLPELAENPLSGCNADLPVVASAV